MDISKVIAISGKTGLYKIISQSKNGFIAEGLHDGKRLPVYKTHQVSGLSDVSIYTEEGEVPLQTVFEAIYASQEGKPALSDAASNEDYKNFMEEVLPAYDRDKVYTSDIKKLVKWYNLLLEKEYFTADENADDQEGIEASGKAEAPATAPSTETTEETPEEEENRE